MPACLSCGNPIDEGARFCPNCGAQVAGAGPEERERKVATMVFADLVGSTSSPATSIPSGHVSSSSASTTRWLRRSRRRVARWRSSPVTPSSRSSAPPRRWRTTPSVRSTRRWRCASGSMSCSGTASSSRTGVNTGDVVGGRPRAGSPFVSGDAVNVAARLEQGAEPGEILVGERPSRRRAERSSSRIRGRSRRRANPAHRGTNADPRGHPHATAASEASEARLSGRDRELETLLRIHEEVARPRSRSW